VWKFIASSPCQANDESRIVAPAPTLRASRRKWRRGAGGGQFRNGGEEERMKGGDSNSMRAIQETRGYEMARRDESSRTWTLERDQSQRRTSAANIAPEGVKGVEVGGEKVVPWTREGDAFVHVATFSAPLREGEVASPKNSDVL
jgi:hypothetical protein